MSDLDEARQKLWAAIGWRPSPDLAEEALTHRSFTNEAMAVPRRKKKQRREAQRGQRNNQRLEFLGDAVLAVCVSELLMRAHPEADEGELSRMRAALVAADPLAEVGRAIDLGAALRLGKGAAAAGDREQRNVLADAIEALVGAAYLEGGITEARAMVVRLLGDRVASVDPTQRDPKSELQERVQGRGGAAPSYRVVDAPDAEGWVRAEVIVDGAPAASGRGRNRKLAEQDAARVALQAWGAPSTHEATP